MQKGRSILNFVRRNSKKRKKLKKARKTIDN